MSIATQKKIWFVPILQFVTWYCLVRTGMRYRESYNMFTMTFKTIFTMFGIYLPLFIVLMLAGDAVDSEGIKGLINMLNSYVFISVISFVSVRVQTKMVKTSKVKKLNDVE